MVAREELDVKLSELTVGDLLRIIGETTSGKAVKSTTIVYGLQGIADIFGVSVSQAKRIKASGIIDDAISQHGRTIVTDADRALLLWHRSSHGRCSNNI